MNKLIRNILFPLLVLLFSCDKPGLFVSCSDCKEEDPVEVLIEAKIDPYELTNHSCEISIFEGNLEDNILISKYTSDTSPVIIKVHINKKYTIMAEYYRYGTFYTAFDSATPRVRYEKDLCEKPCYLVYDNKVDLRIKYTL
jgi:hypothetical protein